MTPGTRAALGRLEDDLFSTVFVAIVVTALILYALVSAPGAN